MHLQSVPPCTPKVLRAAIYARYSTSMQRPASIQQQVRECREWAEKNNVIILEEHIYVDEAKSGTVKAGRAALIALEAAVMQSNPPFDLVLSDDTSRIARDLQDILRFASLLKDNDILFHTVSQDLDSREYDRFEMALQMHGMIDHQYVTRLRAKIKSSQKNQVLNGYHVGSVAYGYRRNVEVSDDPFAIGRAKTRGTRLVVHEGEKEIILRIFQEFSDGRSISQIVKGLNADGVPWPKARHGQWDVSALKRMLRNEKYIGVNVHGMTTQKKDRDGHTKRRQKDREDQTRKELPSLRIVPDELWEKVQQRLASMADKQTARVAGGYARARDRQYPLSGILHCGLCGSKMNVGGLQGKALYACVNHRRGGGCTNNLHIREDVALKQVCQALQEHLLRPEVLEQLVAGVYGDLNVLLAERRRRGAESNFDEFERKLAEVTKKIRILMSGYEQSGSESLLERLRELETLKSSIQGEMKTCANARTFDLSLAELHQLVQRSVAELAEVLKGNGALGRELLQRCLKRLDLYPIEHNGVPAFEVVGQMDVFSNPENQKYRVLLGGLGTREDQQHKVDSTLRFVMRLDLETDYEPAVLQPLARLLREHPELQSLYMTPTEWAENIRPYFSEPRPKKFGSGAFGRAMWADRKELDKVFAIEKIANPENRNSNLYAVALLDEPELASREAPLAA